MVLSGSALLALARGRLLAGHLLELGLAHPSLRLLAFAFPLELGAHEASLLLGLRRHRVPPPYLLRIVSALRSIFFSSEDVRLPLVSCWEPRAFALRAWALSGIGYLRSSGSPYCESLSLSRSFWSRSGIKMALRGRTTAERGY